MNRRWQLFVVLAQFGSRSNRFRATLTLDDGQCRVVAFFTRDEMIIATQNAARAVWTPGKKGLWVARRSPANFAVGKPGLLCVNVRIRCVDGIHLLALRKRDVNRLEAWIGGTEPLRNTKALIIYDRLRFRISATAGSGKPSTSHAAAGRPRRGSQQPKGFEITLDT